MNLSDALLDQYCIQNGSLFSVHPAHPVSQTHKIQNKVFADVTNYLQVLYTHIQPTVPMTTSVISLATSMPICP